MKLYQIEVERKVVDSKVFNVFAESEAEAREKATAKADRSYWKGQDTSFHIKKMEVAH